MVLKEFINLPGKQIGNLHVHLFMIVARDSE